MNHTCPNPNCPCHNATKTSPFGYYKTKAGKRRRFRCQVCKTTFSSTVGTPYFRMRHPRSKFDHVVSLSVEGISKSAISRVQSVDWNTVHRWLEKAAKSCRQSTSYLSGVSRSACPEPVEGQLDMLRCHYNFLRPHRALKCGPEFHTPAMQAGLSKPRFTFRDVFTFLVTLIWMRQTDSKSKIELDFFGKLARIHN